MNQFELATVAKSLLRRLETDASKSGCSLDPFVRRNLEGFILRVRKSKQPEDVEAAGSLLGRFSVDSLEWGSHLMGELDHLVDLAYEISRDLKEKESLKS